jgi:tight adherence protein B
MKNSTLLLSIIIGALSFALVLLFYFLSRRKENTTLIQDRMKSARDQGVRNITAENYNLFEAEHDRLLQTRLDDFFKEITKKRGVKTGYFQKLTAGISTGAGLLVLICSIALAWVLAMLVMGLSVSDGIYYALPAGFALTIMILRKYQKRREKQFLDMFPLAFDIVARGLKAAGTLEKTFKTVSEQIEGPVGREFGRINHEVGFGVPFHEAMINAADRIQIDDFSFFAIALIIQKKAGGSLSELVSTISAFLRKRQELRLKVVALSAEAKMTGVIVGSLPVLVLVALYFMNADTLDILRFDPAGRKLSLFLICYVSLGIVIMQKMSNIKI